MKIYRLSLCFISVFILSSCGTMIRDATVKSMSNTLSSEKTMFVISSENDPELIWDSLPFALKSMEVILAQEPGNREIKLALAAGYISYAQGNLALKAKMMENSDYRASARMMLRAANLSMRGRDYALSALDSKYPRFSEEIQKNPQNTLSQTTKEDVPYLFWASAGWTIGISADINNMESLSQLPVAVALMSRALELDEYYNDAAIHEYFIAYEARKPGSSADSLAASKMHFDKAVQYTKGEKAYPFVIYAESVGVKTQNMELFDSMLEKALAINPDKDMRLRLNNTIAREKALWLQSMKPMLFVDYEEEE